MIELNFQLNLKCALLEKFDFADSTIFTIVKEVYYALVQTSCLE